MGMQFYVAQVLWAFECELKNDFEYNICQVAQHDDTSNELSGVVNCHSSGNYACTLELGSD